VLTKAPSALHEVLEKHSSVNPLEEDYSPTPRSNFPTAVSGFVEAVPITSTAYRSEWSQDQLAPDTQANPKSCAQGKGYLEGTSKNSNIVIPTEWKKGNEDFRKIFIENLDNYSYRIIGIGFSFLTIGILSGAVWANEAWGSYWSWDPKETWAFLTWLVYAIYLHMRLNKGWQGRQSAIIASVGFICVWICFLGVNLIGKGFHSYGFLIS
jgi:cytochrome c-type biogenesis protein CcsB